MKKSLVLQLAICIGIALVFNACIGHTYINTVPNVQTFDSSYLKISGYAGVNHAEVQATVPLSDRVGLQANGFISNCGMFGELAAGVRISPAYSKNQLYLYSGFGMADINNFSEIKMEERFYVYDMTYKRIFLMPVMNFKKRYDDLEFYSGLRLSYVWYDQYKFLCYDKDTKSDYSSFLTDTLANFRLTDFGGGVFDPFIGCRAFNGKNKALIFDFQIFFSFKYFEDLQGFNRTVYPKYSFHHPFSDWLSYNVGITYNLDTKSHKQFH